MAGPSTQSLPREDFTKVGRTAYSVERTQNLGENAKSKAQGANV
jgi:hypothetical protein